MGICADTAFPPSLLCSRQGLPNRNASSFHYVIVIDATLDAAPPGTVRRIQPRYLSDYPRSLAAHDVGLRDLIESAALLGPLPTVYLITISIAAMPDMATELSPPAQQAIANVVALVERTIAEIL